MFDQERATREWLDKIRKTFESSGKLVTEAVMFCRKDRNGVVHQEDEPPMVIAGLIDLDDQEQRDFVQQETIRNECFFAIVANEIWRASANADDAEGVALITRAKQEGTDFKDLPPQYRQELVRVFAEGESTPIRLWEAPIARDGDKPTLGEWSEVPVKLPRPNFKRYLAERNEAGGYVLKVRF